MAVNKVKEIAVDMLDPADTQEKKVETLRRLAATAMNSKLIKRNSDFFTKSEVILRAFVIILDWHRWLTKRYYSGCGCCTFAGSGRP